MRGLILKWILKKLDWRGVDWIILTHVRFHRQDFVNTIMNILFS
jgi:hypothetical protein